MNVNRDEAQDALRAIEQARLAATRSSENNGIILLVWGIAVLVGLICFDLFSPAIAAIVMAVISGGTALWQWYYGRSLPVRPLQVPTAKVVLLWSVYYMIVLFGGTFGSIWLFHHKAPLLYTCIAVLSAAPLLFFGARFWREANRRG